METDFRVYEGNNIKGRKKLIKITLKACSMNEAMKLVSDYIQISNMVGSSERIIDFETVEEGFEAWVTYADEEISLRILSGLKNKEETENILNSLAEISKHGLLYSLIQAAEKKNIPVIKLSSNLYQLGYGKRLVIIGEDYQSFENNANVIISRDKKALDKILRYNNIPGIDMNDKETLIPDYRVICYKGEIVLVLKNEKLQEGMTEWKKEGINESGIEFTDIVGKMVDALKICAMYMDLLVDFNGEIKVIDVGSIFDLVLDKKMEGDISNYIVEGLIEDGAGIIPIISVTGTNGKTTTVRLIYNILQGLGYRTALASTGGVFVGGRRVRSGDTTGFLSAREVLMNNQVEAAVLETARGGILKNGLGYEQAQAAIICSVSEDHIGMSGTKNITDLAKVKSVILSELRDNGKAIVRAQEIPVSITEEMVNVCLFETVMNSYIKEHVNRGKEAMYLEDNWIIYSINGELHKVMKVDDIPFTHYGKSMSNVRNIMAAIAAVLTIHKDYKSIVEIIKTFNCDLNINPGRQNIINMGNFKLIVDYGHNCESIKEVYSIAKACNPSRITTVISVPGDRMDIYIKEMGEVAAQNSDYIIIKEKEDLRGRKLGETAALVEQGALNKGFDKRNLKIIYREEEALQYALDNAESGEVIVLFTQVMENSLPVINDYLAGRNMPPVI